MLTFLKSMLTNLGVVGEMLTFLWRRRLWWLIPMVTALLILGLLLLLATTSGIMPFIYTLF